MTDNVVPLLGAPGPDVDSDAAAVRKAQFMDYLALRYDDYVRDTGCVPDATLMALGGIAQPVETSWMFEGDSQRFERAFFVFVLERLRNDMTDRR